MTAPGESLAGLRVSRGRMPDFFLVGYNKSGTTAMYRMLKRHPQIYMPDLKEPCFFGRKPRAPNRSLGGRPETFQDYLALFEGAGPEQRVGEASTPYLRRPTAAAAIAEVQPAARIVAILREPASFVRSTHLQLLQGGFEQETDLRKALSLKRPDQDVLALRFANGVQYVEHLRRYHAAFPSEQVLILIYDDFRQDNESTVRRVLRFLDVDDTAPIDVVDANPTVGVRSKRLDKMVTKLTVGRKPVPSATKAAIKMLSPRPVRDDVIRTLRRLRSRAVYVPPPPPDETFMEELRRRFKPEVVALSEYLDRDLVTLWGYDRIG